MKVILLKDVAKIGRRSQVVEVPDGYARNQLIPKRWADPATPANIKRIEQMNAKNAATADADVASFMALKEAVGETKITIETEVNEQNHLFKAISAEEVVAAAGAAGFTIAASQVSFATPIKEAGEQTVTLTHDEHSFPLTIVISKK